MTADIRQLHAIEPLTTTEEIRAEVVKLLAEALAKAEAGDVNEVLIIMAHPDGQWSNLSTATQSITTWIGRLHITIIEWTEHFRRHHDRQ